MLFALSAEGAEYLVVGAYAMAFHGFVRSTGDLDLWVRPTRENAQRVWRALMRFGVPLKDLTVEDLASPDIGFQMGTPPRRIDILTSISGVDFESAWNARSIAESFNVQFPVIGPNELLQNKKATGRPKDLLDAQWMEQGLGD